MTWPDAADLGVARSFQQEEIPAAPAERVQHDLHEARCACGRVHVAARPAGVPDSALSIGPRLRALAVYLVVFQHVPVERCRQLIADVTGAAVSDGFIHSCLAKAACLAADVVRLIRALITAAAVAGFDETTLRSGPAGEKKYVHGAFTERVLGVLAGRPGAWTPWRTPGSSRASPGSWSPTATRTTSPQVGAHRREPGVPGSHTARLRGLRRELPGRGLARAGAAGAARHDPCLARRP